MTAPKAKPSVRQRSMLPMGPWGCGHDGCSQWGALFEQPDRSWAGRPVLVQFNDGSLVVGAGQKRRCHYHSGLFKGGR